MIKRLLILLLVMFALPAFAMELSDAKEQGLVGEANTGYLAPVKNIEPDEKLSALIEEVNQGRTELFNRIAGGSSASLEQVKARFYQRAVVNTKPGNYVQTLDGRWVKVTQ